MKPSSGGWPSLNGRRTLSAGVCFCAAILWMVPFLRAAEPSKSVPSVEGAKKTSETPQGIAARAGQITAKAGQVTAEAQWRSQLNTEPPYYRMEENFPPLQGQDFVLAEIYLANHGKEPVEWTRVWVDGKAADDLAKVGMVDGKKSNVFPNRTIVWWQFYPVATCAPGETVCLQINF
ncbi:MAG: hypothetical protein HY360_03985 [Verrucomicrobia bacterium]|nr:hypothetical protein [Verrucomicrobiota bacterium]